MPLIEIPHLFLFQHFVCCPHLSSAHIDVTTSFDSNILQNHHLAHFHVLSMLARLVRPIIPFPSPMLMILLLPHKSNPFFCPSHRSSLPQRAKPPPYPSLFVPFCPTFPNYASTTFQWSYVVFVT